MPRLTVVASPLKARGMRHLPPAFRDVVQPFHPRGQKDPLWQPGDSDKLIAEKCLDFLASNLVERAFPALSGILPGDGRIFLQPPTTDRKRADAEATPCMCLTKASVSGLTGRGRYRCGSLTPRTLSSTLSVGVTDLRYSYCQ